MSRLLDVFLKDRRAGELKQDEAGLLTFADSSEALSASYW